MEFESWTRLFAFHFALMKLEKVCIQLFLTSCWISEKCDSLCEPYTILHLN